MTKEQIIHKIKKPFPYLKVENFYNEEELKKIWKELEFITDENKLNPPELTFSAFDEKDGRLLKKNYGVFLEEIYTNRNISNILKVNRKLFSESITSAFADLNFAYNLIYHTNYDATLVSYYEDGGYYKPHSDSSVYTALTWIFKEPKRFTGGNFHFSDHKETIEIKNNMMVIFPSFVRHSVDRVKMEENLFSGYGRYCISQFISLNPRKSPQIEINNSDSGVC